MKTILPVLTGVLGVLTWAASPASAQTTPAAPKAGAPAATSADAVAPYIQSIQQATDPSALITAYANGFAVDRTSLKLHEAYVSRMVDFGLPEMAYHQAELAASLNPRNGMVRGVLAYVYAKRGQMAEAMAEIAQAANLSPDQPFVQRTTGELLAWYDRNFLTVKIPDALKVSLDGVRSAMSSRAQFAQAYDDARKALAEQAAEAAAEKATAPAGSSAPPTTQPSAQNDPANEQYPPDAYVYPSGGGYGYSQQPQDYAAPYPYYYPWTGDWWYPTGFFWGGGTAFVFNGRHHHHDWGGGQGSWNGHNAGLFSRSLSPQQQLQRAVAAVQPGGAAIAANSIAGRGTASATGTGGVASASLFRGGAAGSGGGTGIAGGAVLTAVNGQVISRAHSGEQAAMFTSGNLEPSAVQTVHASASVANSGQNGSVTVTRGSSSAVFVGHSSSSVAGSAVASTAHETHVAASGGGGGGARSSHGWSSHGWSSAGGGSGASFAASSGGHVAASSGGSHGWSSSGGGGGARFTALPGGHVGYSSGGGGGGGGHFSGGSSGGHFSGGGGHFSGGGGHGGGGHR
jgi:hypothetical protein